MEKGGQRKDPETCRYGEEKTEYLSAEETSEGLATNILWIACNQLKEAKNQRENESACESYGAIAKQQA